jgi:genome maintenance exonuclease 1
MFTHCPPKELGKLKSITQPDGQRFYTLPSGQIVPSVTTVLGAKPKPHLENWKKKVGEQEANRIVSVSKGRGTRLHTLAENYLKNKSLGTTMPDAMEMFLSVKPIINRINNIQYQEQNLWSEKYGIAGTCDCIAEYEGKLSVIDFKNSRKIKAKEWITDYFIQCTAYACMYEELIGKSIEQSVIIMAVENEKPLVFIEKTSDYINTLVNYIDYYRKNK